MSEQIKKVLADRPQAFSTAEQKQARDNMMPYLSLTYLIRYEPEVRVPRMLMFNGCMPCAPSGAYLQGRK